MRIITTAVLMVTLAAGAASAQRIMEQLDRGLVAIQTEEGVYLSWRMLESDPASIDIKIFRIDRPRDHEIDPMKGGTVQVSRLNPSVDTTDFSHHSIEPGKTYTYSLTLKSEASETLKAGGGGVEITITDTPKPYISIPLRDGIEFRNLAIADLDGDGKYDYIVKHPQGNVDPWHLYWKRSEGTYKIDAYNHDGSFMWRYDFGWAIEQGTWYSPFVVYDFDGDGKAEVALKSGEGDPRDADGKVTSGPEYLSLLNGTTGKEITRLDWPTREGFREVQLYNRSSRNQLCVAYLDGVHPYLVAERGTYGTMKAVAYRMQDRKLVEYWRWDNTDLGGEWQGQGAHWTQAVDLDGDGKDEVLLGSSVLDDDGAPLWTTGLGHPDHAYVGDLDPTRPGLEIYYGIESRKDQHGMSMADAATGAILWGYDGPTRHVHSHGMCSDIDPRFPGSEAYSADTDAEKKAEWARLWSARGDVISKEMPWGFGPRTVYWDADPQRELIVGNRIIDYRGETPHTTLEGRVVAVADVLGDWREEVITSLAGELRIYVSTIPAEDRRVCLMRDPLYRNNVAAASMGYYQVPMLSYDMASE